MKPLPGKSERGLPASAEPLPTAAEIGAGFARPARRARRTKEETGAHGSETLQARSRARIRPYRSADRDAVRHVCCETGLGGDPVDPLFPDRETFADYLTRYYTDHEPESTLVVEEGGRVIGYLAGCLRYRFHWWVQTRITLGLLLRTLARLALGRYDRAARRYIAWCLLRARREIPSPPSRAAHLHVNLLPSHRHRGLGLRLFRHFMGRVREREVERVWARTEAPQGKRSDAAFARFGFHLVERRRLTRFTGSAEPVHVTAYLWERAGGKSDR